jgi:hypothetical protein
MPNQPNLRAFVSVLSELSAVAPPHSSGHRHGNMPAIG